MSSTNTLTQEQTAKIATLNEDIKNLTAEEKNLKQ